MAVTQPATGTRTVGTALVGTGLAGRYFHAPHIAVHDAFDIVALLQRSSVLTAEDDWMQLAPNARLVHSIAEIATLSDAELVVIASPDATHFEFAKACLQGGKHVLIDKPMAQTVAQAYELLSIAAASKLLCMPFQNRRYDGDFLTVAKLLKAGSLGRLVEYEAHFDRCRPSIPSGWKERERGTLANLGPHLIDQAVYLFGEPTHVQADIGILRKGGTADDYCQIELFYCDATSPLSASAPVPPARLPGLVAPPRKSILKSSVLAPDNDLRYVLHGTGGSFVKRGLDGQEAALCTAGRVVLPGTASDGWGVEDAEKHGVLIKSDPITGAVLSRETVTTEPGSYLRLYDTVAEALQSDDPSAAQSVSALQAMATMHIIELARVSAAEGRRVPFTRYAPTE